MTTSFNEPIIEEFRANAGQVGGPFDGSDLLLLTTTGAKSGKENTAPLGYVTDGDRLLVVASAGGADHHPAWYHNLLAHPMVRVELGTETFEAIAVPAEGSRRDQLFEQVVRVAPGYADYQAGTERTIPVVELERFGQVEDPAEVTTLAAKLVEIHTWLRSLLGQVRAEADAYFGERANHEGPGEAPAPGLGLQLRQHCLAFCEALEFHHTGEDAHMFPGLAQAHPHLGDAIARLREEHTTVERIQRELLALLGGISTADPAPFRAELERMTAELEAHLDYEEESLLPVLAEIPFPPPAPDPAGADTPA
ncbi:deazaflavin-dependent oxidoreductase (nitroreductase family) [Murinocardiopsis flavida]|uniref:Deazaflavin-dependent oxidoreductase (Nitroreductase family) n=1 Tax=Murinocardiopsis flavida TaxID=645275 RepID=A0A2P8DSF3_9ACTN|nr:nitroreductase/quinone reductase family protein [Murinocardiopsis flavida]PSL00149.1 deazaflavin-dependent oxidoreductase (nitroreductase family) [Murinocardiopsis flavida]